MKTIPTTEVAQKPHLPINPKDWANGTIGKIQKTLVENPPLVEAAKSFLVIGGLIAVCYYGIKMIITGESQYPFKGEKAATV